jgi:hypothetical protein
MEQPRAAYTRVNTLSVLDVNMINKSVQTQIRHRAGSITV